MVTQRSVAILGSTGSIGTQALDVISQHPERFKVVSLAAGGHDVAALAAQASRLGVDAVAISDDDRRTECLERLESAGGPLPEVLSGPDAATEVAGRGADVVLNGITGSVGLRPTLAALEAGSTLALANKESLVAGGALVKQAVQHPDQIVPVDSEHSAIAQCLRSGTHGEVRRLILTASGGPFRGYSRNQLAHVTLAEALNHPTWSMGPVVTINSAGMMNKGLELIEAHLLFDVDPGDITVVVHPQSVIHSGVEFVDGSTILQASPPDMRLPIALGLSWPDRLDPVTPPCDWSTATAWTFEPLDEEVFPAVNLAREAVRASATHPAVLNAANEQCVDAFLRRAMRFSEIPAVVAEVLAQHDGVAFSQVTLSDVEHAETWARRRADEILEASCLER
ncbi:MAG: 1-deoxy-D-xylulose-5-phosphate reductoisomerase [Cellulomonadaceae bacterium]|nr:1-deoxy-D-xylulose-5-phosphate reductoisomerase [Cellulomonadaceae bacterium]